MTDPTQAVTSPDSKTADQQQPKATEDKGGAVPPPPEVQQILNQLPPDQRHTLERSFAMLVQGPMVNPIAAKIDKDHLNKIFDGIENDNRRMYDDEHDERKHVTARAICGTLAFLVASGLFLWFGQVALLKDLVIYLVLIAGGVGIGKGFLQRDKE